MMNEKIFSKLFVMQTQTQASILKMQQSNNACYLIDCPVTRPHYLPFDVCYPESNIYTPSPTSFTISRTQHSSPHTYESHLKSIYLNFKFWPSTYIPVVLPNAETVAMAHWADADVDMTIKVIKYVFVLACLWRQVQVHAHIRHLPNSRKS